MKNAQEHVNELMNIALNDARISPKQLIVLSRVLTELLLKLDVPMNELDPLTGPGSSKNFM